MIKEFAAFLPGSAGTNDAIARAGSAIGYPGAKLPEGVIRQMWVEVERRKEAESELAGNTGVTEPKANPGIFSFHRILPRESKR